MDDSKTDGQIKRRDYLMSKEKKTLEKKANTKNGILRLAFAAIAVLLEAGILISMFLSGLDKYAELIAIVSRIFAFFLVLGIYSQNKTASIKMPWIILIISLPAIGVFLYLMIGLSGSTKFMKKRFQEADQRLMPCLVQNSDVLSRLKEEDAPCAGISSYLLRESGYPVYTNTDVTYFDDAAKGLEAQKEALRAAKQFIFMEYYAIENAQSWHGIEEILEDKVREGVEVRVFYDDFGSIGFINTDFARRLSKKGINCRVFNPMTPLFNIFLNNRDHRKMTIIDGKIGFTGGYNLADEYFNITSPYGRWKDTGVRIEGEAVRPMTITFLEMWNAIRHDDEDDKNISAYLPDDTAVPTDRGYVQFYADTPLDKKAVGEEVYLNMVNRAQDYIYFMTPYLIITDEMSRMLCLAAKKGVDVRIITPGIPDKKVVYSLTRSYYNRLVSAGVRIFEYSPGFCHGKMSVSDDIIATCGTINLDYRSLYHHFEDGCLMIDCDAVTDIKKDMDETMELCREVTEKYRTGRSAALRLGQLFLRLFAPLM